jgi:DEAD/DEAH box helicase
VERALDLGLLTAALAGRTGVPTAQELQQLMADVEVQLFLRRAELPQEVLDAAWYLHAVASVNEARERYTVARQRQAFLVSTHIFDLALNDDAWSPIDRLSFGFAAAIGYRRGGRDPNATAIMNRLLADIDVESPLLDHIDTLALEAGLAFLGFETRTLIGWLGGWRRELAALARASELQNLTTTAFGTAHMVVLGAEDLLAYFARGDSVRLERGRARLRTAAIGEAGPGDLDARWVAAHLLALSWEAEAGSLWNPTVLPPSVPDLVRQAFTVGTPPVLTLWEPQRDLLTGSRSPFDPQVRRMVLAVPTSGGKTLLAQMLAVEHLARTDRGVCYVAPTRSLGREVRRAMANRVRILQKESGPDQPDFPALADLLDALDDTPPADVEVMTPERLAHLLRHDAPAVLEHFGMFIFDEAQHLKEAGRGFTLESTIALLDYLTWETEHQIVLISAAMGNAGAIAQWLSPDGQALRHESQWRGPRRLDAAFNTQAHWEGTRVENVPSGRVWPYRFITELSGQIRLRMADGRTSLLSTEGDTGWRLVRKSRTGDPLQRRLPIDRQRSTKHYEIASQMIVELGHAGSALVVGGTRDQAHRLARGLADALDEHPGMAPLVDFVRLQLGDDHPLVGVLRHGVGFHHAGLPIEVLEALEDAVRDDTLPYLTCTSTLTDGVNLPVRTVVIYDQTYEGQPDDTRLRGARLVNAMGRAGRAGKETEGWIVLVRAAAPTEADFRDLSPDAETLAVTSALITDEALEAFAALEQASRDDEDALFRASGPAADFISFVWLVLAVEEDRGADPSTVDIAGIVDATLAASQSPLARAACMTVAQTVRRAYLQTDTEARRRWPRTGISIGSARIVDRLARRLANTIITKERAGTLGDIRDPQHAVRMPSTIGRLLELPEAPPWRFRVSTQGADIEVKPAGLLAGWLAGTSLSDLAEAHLAAATNPAWRIEQMVNVVTRHFEHYLAWTVGALVELVNTHLAEAGTDERLCPELGGYIRYGVRDPEALILMASGIRSRRLVHAVVADLPADFEATRENLRYWLAGLGVPEWRSRYNATPSEVLDLLDFTRLRRRSLLKTLLETGSVDVELPVTNSDLPNWDGPLTLEPMRGEPRPAPLVVYAGDEHIVMVGSQDHADLSAMLDTGLDIEVEIGEQADPPRLSVTLPFGDATD